jgi:hypothetical protein
MRDEETRAVELVIQKAATQLGPQLLKYVKDVLFVGDTESMKPKNRHDWRAIDFKIAAIQILSIKADSDYRDLIFVDTAKPVTRESAERVFQASTYRQAVAMILVTHAQFVIENIYRDNNADFYFDRIYSAVEGTLHQTQDARVAIVEKQLAKVRSLDRQVEIERSANSEGRKGSEGSEGGAKKA